MSEFEIKKIERLLLGIQVYKDVPFYSFMRKHRFDHWEVICDEIRNIFPQLLIQQCEDMDYFKIHFVILSRKTKEILIKIDMDYDDDTYDVVYKILCFCDDYLHQHTLVKTDSTSPQIHHCICCGAALKRGSYKCEYCDTEYW